MGVAGLWEVLRPAGEVRSLTELAVEDRFNANPSRQRGFRIGIDASIWFFHAAYGREGENPELRTLFFRCCRLLQSPLLPLFVFDGPNRPAVKRGKRVGGNAHWLTQGMKNIIDAFGFEWRIAPGEAEAELAYLNRVGIIDAVLSDDVDNFLFGATMVIRNPSNTLSGNRAHPVKNAHGKDDGNHVVTYTANAILSNPSIALSRSGTILIGLLSGGDYIPAGLPGCGQKFATGLARAGFGDSLMKAARELKGARLDAFLDQWRQDIRNELKTNKSGLLPSKKPSLAASLPDDFPSLPVLMSYADPITSENIPQKGSRNPPSPAWRNDPDPMRIASLCELYFEWGVKDVIVQRFRTVLWPGIVCRAVRRAVIDQDTHRHPLGRVSRHDSEGGADRASGPSSPMKDIASTFSLALSSPPKKSSALRSDASAPESFLLSSLAPLSSPSPHSSSRSTSPSIPTPGPSPLLLEVLSQRTHVSTDATLEYRVVIDPTTLVERAESGVKGLRPPLIGGLFGIDPEDENEDGGTLDQDADESGSDDAAVERLETAAGAASKSGVKKRKARREVPTTPLRLWLPACMIRAAVPVLAEAYEDKVKAREEKKAKRGTKGGRGRRVGTAAKLTSSKTKVKDDTDDDRDEPVPGPSDPKTVGRSKITKSKVVRVGGRGGRRKPKQASEAQNDAYEFIDLSAGESPCSSDGDGVKENTKGKAKAKAGLAGATTKPMTKASRKTDATSRKAVTTNSMIEFRNLTKPSTVKASKSKPVSSRRVCEEEHDDSTDTALPPPLPRSLRPLDLLRAKSKPVPTIPSPTSKAKLKSLAVPRYEEEESSSGSRPQPSGSKPNASSLPSQRVQLALQTKKKPLFVDVSDSDSDIEVSEVRRPLSGTTGIIGTHNVTSGTVESRSKNELPSFHGEPARSRAKKITTTLQSEPRPFPMRLAPNPPASPCTSRLRESHKQNDDDEIEFVDVFTTPRGPSPPRSPTPSPSPVQPLPLDASMGPSTFVKSRQSDGFPISPTKSVRDTDSEPRQKAKQRHCTSSDDDPPPFANRSNGIHKSPRKSATHSSPRYVSCVRGRASSPTPLSASEAKAVLLWTGDFDGCHSEYPRPQPDESETMDMGESNRRKSWVSDASAIYISSGSEDDNDVELGANHSPDGKRVTDECTDSDTNIWADTGTVLSAPPSPPVPTRDDVVPALPDVEVGIPNPTRGSRFKPAPAATSKAEVRAPSSECQAPAKTSSTSLGGTTTDKETTLPWDAPVRCIPLLVARAKCSKGGDDDIIDLTSD